MIDTNFISLYQQSFRKHWDSPALTNYGGDTYYYKDVAERIARLHLLFERLSLREGDRVAIIGKDSAEWCIIFMATITYGAVIVPLLPDFPAEDAMGIIRHSGARLLFSSREHWGAMRHDDLPEVEEVMEIQSWSPLSSRKSLEGLRKLVEALPSALEARFPQGFRPEGIVYRERPNEEMILLNYTSGTTGFSKGVMVSGANLAGNVLFCRERKILSERERLLCFLPMAHTYSCTVNLLLALSLGTHVYILGRVPTPNILIAALGEVRPRVIVSVPLVLEKIYQSKLQPLLQTSKMRFLTALPGINRLIYRKIRRTLVQTLGGEVDNFIVGGAALNPEVGRFLKRIGFPIAVGYGMTECAPLISYSLPKEWRLGSCGQVLRGYMQVRIVPEVNEEGKLQELRDEKGRPIGEIQVRGTNTCMGYYKNEEQTSALFTEDGWLRTGDLGSVDSDDFIYIRGRSKNMLLGPSGQNIYPEEIEAKISLLPYVMESLVLLREGKLEAIIVPNPTLYEAEGLTEAEAWERIVSKRDELNARLGSYEKVIRFELRREPFEKTPKQSIKRFLYS